MRLIKSIFSYFLFYIDMYRYTTTTFKNGLKILKIPNKETDIIILQISMKLGNDIETLSTLETSHFIEHLFSMFTSPKYPNGKINRETLSFNNIDLDAEVINKNIKFVLEFDVKHSEYVVDLVSHALLDFKVDESIFKQEKNAVIEELNEIIKDSDYKFDTKINSIMYKGHQRAYSEKDRLQNTKKITSNDIEKYYKTHFSTKNYIISIFGNLPTKHFSYLKKQMELLKNTNNFKYSPYTINLNQHIIYHKNTSNISNLKIYFKTNYTIFDSEYYIIKALIDILTGDLNSLLLKELRNEKGLVYHCSGDFDLDEVNKGLSHIELVTLCNSKNLLKVITIIIDILRSVKYDCIDNRYVDSYCSEMKLQKKREMFSKRPRNQLMVYSKYFVWNKPIISFNEDFKKLCNVNKTQLKYMGSKIFTKNNIIICYDGLKNMDSSIQHLINNL